MLKIGEIEEKNNIQFFMADDIKYFKNIPIKCKIGEIDAEIVAFGNNSISIESKEKVKFKTGLKVTIRAQND